MSNICPTLLHDREGGLDGHQIDPWFGLPPISRADNRRAAMRILLVEDDPAVQTLHRMILRHAGYVVDVADNGWNGVQMAIGLMPRLIVMNIDLPILNGWEAIELIRASPETRHIPICVVSAGPTIETNALAMTFGCETVFLKPLRPSDLLAEVRRITGVST